MSAREIEKQKLLEEFPVTLEDLELSLPELRFVGEYCANGYNAPKAYKNSHGEKDQSIARIKGLTLAGKPKVLTAIRRFTCSVLDPYKEVMEHQLLDFQKTRAFFDITDYYNEDGSAKPLSEIPEDARKAIDGVKEQFFGKDANTRVVTYELGSRKPAMDYLVTLIKMSKEKDDTVPRDLAAKMDAIFKAGATVGASAAIGANMAIQDSKEPELRDVSPREEEEVKPIGIKLDFIPKNGLTDFHEKRRKQREMEAKIKEKETILQKEEIEK
jgi:hypothetical protein